MPATWTRLHPEAHEACASVSCGHSPASWRMDAGGVGSWFCEPCRVKVMCNRLMPLDMKQPDPQRSSSPAMWDLVLVDMAARDRVGRATYGTALQAHNGRDALKDAYAEMLDACVYLRQAIYERDGE